MITQRGWAVIAAGLATFAVALFTLNLLIFLIAIIVVAVAATEIVTFSLTTWKFQPSWFVPSRIDPRERIGSGGIGIFAITLTHVGPRGFWAEVYDTVPASFDVVDGAPRLQSWWARGASMTLAYAVRPTFRGVYAVGPTIVVAHDPMGLAFRVTVLPTRLTVTVAPPFPTTRVTQLGHRMPNRISGSTLLRRRGFGTEFRSLRPYGPGDDVRSIAWKRSTPEQLIVRESEQESREEFVVVLDAGAAMGSGPAGATAFDHATDAAGLLSSYVAHREDRLGLLVYSDQKVEWIPPGRGARHALTVAHSLTRVHPAPGTFDIGGALRFLATRLRGRAQVLAFTALNTPLTNFPRDHAEFATHGHRLHLFVPRIPGLYPAPTGSLSTAAVDLATRIEEARATVALTTVRRRGVPTFLYDQSGATARLLTVYSRLRAWGVAW
ncbi:MAG: DUF58 domain-containing protein [Thermoplasmata archaeon]|nr:DUF58 domain-containing protein [Thermoplasmata archaeon]